MAYLDEKLFFAGLNTDDEDRGLQNGDYRYALNTEIAGYMNSATGVAEKDRGNRQVPYTLPSGVNTCIGSCRDEIGDRVFYFVYNSNGNHGIYEYSRPSGTVFEISVDPALNFMLNHRINHANVVDGKLLYWTDGENPPRKININKAKSFDKKRSFYVNFGDQCATGETYSFQVFNPSGTLVETFTATVAGTGGTAFVVTKAIVNQYTSTFVTLESCGATLEASMKNIGAYTLTCQAFSNAFAPLPNQVIVTANNFYPAPYIEDFIDRLKYPPNCEPKAVYKYDPNFSVNLVQDRVFQFAVRYIYDDYEKSALSPHSVIPTYNSGCGAITSAGNYIEVDFTDSRINNPNSRSIISAIDILFKEHNDGVWKIAETLERDQFGINSNIYKFYNSGVYTAISNNESDKLYDTVPIKCGTSEFIGNRIFDGDITENYDNVCVDADISVSYQSIGANGITIKGLLSVLCNRRTTANPMDPLSNLIREPLYTYEQATGFTKAGYGYNCFLASANSQVATKYTVAIDDYNQQLGSNGFVVYLAGTDYYATTVQKTAVGFTGYQDPVTGLVSIDSTRLDPANNLNWDDASKIDAYIGSGKGFQSEWSISGVQPGRYSLRVASHLVTPQDISAGKDTYQKTSTTIMPGSWPFTGTLLGVANTGKYEALIEVNANGSVDVYDPFSLQLLYSSPTGDCGETFVCNPAYSRIETFFITTQNTNPSFVYAGYYVDGAQAALPATLQDALAEDRIAYAAVECYVEGQPNNSFAYPSWTLTDHNGFFYCAAPAHQSYYVNLTRISTKQYSNPTILNNGLPNHAVYFYYTYPALNGNRTTSGATYIVLRLNDSTTTRDRRTNIVGSVVDQYGNPVQGVNVAMLHGLFTETDALGQFSITSYLPAGSVSLLEVFLLLSSANYNCRFSFTSTISINYATVGPNDSNNVTPFTISPAFVVVVLMQPYTSAFKRGFDGTFGIVYYDRGNRSGTVNTIEPLQLHIPYYTEKDPVTGTIPTGDLPLLTWSIKHNPPSWATHYQWVRTKNLQTSFFLEWAVDSVDYVNEALSTAPAVPAATAKMVRISYDNLIFYQEQNPDSILAYTYQDGDRIRLRSNAAGVYFTQYLDYKILGVDTNYLFIENNSFLNNLQAGTVVEIYRSNLQTNEKLYYEFGECYEIYELNGVKYHAGPLQNQTASANARGIFNTGDVWYRRRSIPYNTSTSPQQVIVYLSDPNVSDFYISDDQNIGRINIENRDTRQIRREKAIRFSNPYVVESFINGLSTFDGLDVSTIDKGEGPIYKMQKSGRVLICLQQAQVNALYINEVIYIDATGSQSLTKSDKVIATKNPLSGLYGTVNPESVAEYEGRVYFFDKTAGVVVRYSTDGLNPISFYKFRKAIQNKAMQMSSLQRDKTLAIGGIDPMMRKYILSFQKTDPTVTFTDETVSFSEPLNRWISYYSYIPENIEYVGIEQITFKNGQVWVHDGPGYAEYYGVQYPNQITVVSNMGSDKVRNFSALSTESSHAFHFPAITVPVDGGQMMTRILPNKERFVEGVFYYVIPKDMNSPNFATQTEALINGRDMRGHVISVTLQNDNTNQVRIYALNVRFITSEFSKK